MMLSSAFPFTLENNSSQQINDLELSLTSLSDYIEILDGNVSIENLSQNNSIEITELTIFVSSDVPDLDSADLRVSLNSNYMEWNYVLPIYIFSGNMADVDSSFLFLFI